MATLKGESVRGSDDGTAQIDEDMNRQMRRLEEANAQWDAARSAGSARTGNSAMLANHYLSQERSGSA